jgi:DNA-binding SARP family transcriptional activator/tetratricopeptide (TPR) repeat protein
VAWRILGPVEIVVDGAVLAIQRPQERAMVAHLLLNANLVVSTERLIDALWGFSPPPTARTMVQTYVSRVRRALRDSGAGDPLISQAGGYRLVVADDALDLAIFADRMARARAAVAGGDPAAAAALVRTGLALWRGPALSGAVGEFVASAAAGLTEQRLAAYEELADAELALGRHEAVVADLSPLLWEHPLRERLAARLMIALAGCGRQAEALRVHADIRSRLIDELGVEPGAEIDAAHLRVLRQQVPAAPAVPRADAAPTAVPRAVRAFGGAVRRPAQLPPDIPVFAGRAAHLRQLDMLLPAGGAGTPAAVVVSAIDGTAGIGKTTLAVHWAHRVADRFPDGQLYVNLRGFAPSGSPMTPAEALRGFLDALDVPQQRIPVGLDAQSTLYRSLLADKRMLVVLDNARDAEQVRPLLPGAAGCQVVVTSRNRLTSLIAVEGAHLLTLDVLTDHEARQLLAHRLGAGRVADEPDAVEDIIVACARLPLALAIVAAHAASQPRFPLATLAAGLREARGGLDAFDGGDPVSNVRAVFSWSYATLSPEAARLFRLLGLHPGPDISLVAAASLAGAPAAQARRWLAELVRAHLITERSPGRYTCHDLLRAYATEQAHAYDDDGCRRAALHRMLDHYVHTAHRAAMALNPVRDPMSEPLRPAQPGVTVADVADHDQALAWFGTEHAMLVAVVGHAADAGLDTHAWQLAWTLVEFLDRRGLWHDWAATQTVALQAAQRRAHLSGQAQAHRGIGTAYIRLRRHDEAHTHFRRALALFGELDDQAGQVHTHFDLCAVFEGQGRYREALCHAQEALERYRAAGHERGTAQALNAIGWYHAQVDEYEQAVTCCRQALALLRTLGDRHGQAESWDSLGYAHHQLGQHSQAATCYLNALALCQEVGDRFGEASALTHLGDSHLAAGDPVAAREAWQPALVILDELGLSDADEVRAKLDLLALPAADRTDAPA